MRIGIVGSGEDKFTGFGASNAIATITNIVCEYLDVGVTPTVVSGHSPIGGIDIWAEEIAELYDLPTEIHAPEIQQWNPPGGYGYKARNLDIAKSDEVHCIVPDVYPEEYEGMRFDLCYHCKNNTHIKSGGCWTMKQANRGILHIVRNY